MGLHIDTCNSADAPFPIRHNANPVRYGKEFFSIQVRRVPFSLMDHGIEMFPPLLAVHTGLSTAWQAAPVEFCFIHVYAIEPFDILQNS